MTASLDALRVAQGGDAEAATLDVAERGLQYPGKGKARAADGRSATICPARSCNEANHRGTLRPNAAQGNRADLFSFCSHLSSGHEPVDRTPRPYRCRRPCAAAAEDAATPTCRREASTTRYRARPCHRGGRADRRAPGALGVRSAGADRKAKRAPDAVAAKRAGAFRCGHFRRTQPPGRMIGWMF